VAVLRAGRVEERSNKDYGKCVVNMTTEEDWTHHGKDLLNGGKAGLTCWIAGRSCWKSFNRGGKRLSRDKVLATSEVIVEGKSEKISQSIQCTEPDCGVLCCAASPKCIAQMKLHFEKHLVRNTAEISIEECHSSALYWRYFFSQDFDNATRSRGALVDLLQRKNLMEVHLSHSDVKSCGICKTALGPVVFSTQKSFLCLPCFVRVAGISAEHAFRDDKCFLRW
jgi:hypothetical protein